MENKKESLNENKFLLIFSGILVSLILMFGSQAIPIIDLAVFTFYFGSFCAIASLGLLCFEFFKIHKVNANKGIAWIWAVGLLTIVLITIAWYALAPVALMIMDFFSVNYNFPESWNLLLDVIRNVIIWFLVLMVFGILIWAYVSSQRPQDVSYPYD